MLDKALVKLQEKALAQQEVLLHNQHDSELEAMKLVKKQMEAERSSLVQAVKKKRDVKAAAAIKTKKVKTAINDAPEEKPRTHADNVADHKVYVKKQDAAKAEEAKKETDWINYGTRRASNHAKRTLRETQERARREETEDLKSRYAMKKRMKN